jgi:hypothetical protein
MGATHILGIMMALYHTLIIMHFTILQEMFGIVTIQLIIQHYLHGQQQQDLMQTQ